MTPRRILLPLLSALLLAPMAMGATKASDKPQKPENPLQLQIDTARATNFKKEITALGEAVLLLQEVKDEKTAKTACTKITSLFKNLAPLLGGSANDLEQLARAQNRMSLEMWRLLKEPFFEKTELQAAWTLMTDPFSRPSANK